MAALALPLATARIRAPPGSPPGTLALSVASSLPFTPGRLVSVRIPEPGGRVGRRRALTVAAGTSKPVACGPVFHSVRRDVPWPGDIHVSYFFHSVCILTP